MKVLLEFIHYNLGFVDQVENEGKDKMIRHHVEKFLYQTNTGHLIEMFIGIISLISSLTFVILTYFPEGVSCWTTPE